jgi:hypothetical protein
MVIRKWRRFYRGGVMRRATVKSAKRMETAENDGNV